MNTTHKLAFVIVLVWFHYRELSRQKQQNWQQQHQFVSLRDITWQQLFWRLKALIRKRSITSCIGRARVEPTWLAEGPVTRLQVKECLEVFNSSCKTNHPYSPTLSQYHPYLYVSKNIIHKTIEEKLNSITTINTDTGVSCIKLHLHSQDQFRRISYIEFIEYLHKQLLCMIQLL